MYLSKLLKEIQNRKIRESLKSIKWNKDFGKKIEKVNSVLERCLLRKMFKVMQVQWHRGNVLMKVCKRVQMKE